MKEAPIGLTDVLARCAAASDVAVFYQGLAQRGYGYGPRFRRIERLWRGAGEAVALMAPVAAGGMDPALVDACLHVLLAAAGDPRAPLWVPVAIAEYSEGAAAPGGRLWTHARVVERRGDGITGEVAVLDDAGAEVVTVRGLRLAPWRAPAAPAPVDWIHEVLWQPAPAPPVAAADGRWLIACDDVETGRALARELASRRGECVLLDARQIGEASRHLASGSWRGVVALWGMDDEVEPDPPDAAETCCGELLALARQVIAHRAGGARIWVVTRAAQPAGDMRRLAIAQAPLWGMGRTMAREHPELWGGLVDLCPTAPEDEMVDLVDSLCAPEGGHEWAFRRGVRHAPRLRPTAGRLDGAGFEARPDASYLVSGGLGALGLATARWLAARGARHLVLVGRSQPGPAVTRELDALRAGGVRATIVQADVANREEIERLVATTAPRLAGVVHCAGVLDDHLLAGQDAARLTAVMAPKVQGSWNLHRATEDLSLDFFVLYSSTASVLGAAGQTGYAAGNAFMDALAHQRRRMSLPALAIGWGPWAGGGMAAGLPAGHWQRLGMTPMDASRALSLLPDLLAGSAPQELVLSVDWSTYVAASALGAAGAKLYELVRGGGGGRARAAGPLLEELARRPAAARRRYLVDHLKKEVGRILGLASFDGLDPEQPLMEAGVDSLMGEELRVALENGCGRPLGAAIIYAYPTIDKIASYLLELADGEPAPPAPPAPVEAARDAGATDDDPLVRLLSDLGSLSDAEAAEQLARLPHGTKS